MNLSEISKSSVQIAEKSSCTNENTKTRWRTIRNSKFKKCSDSESVVVKGAGESCSNLINLFSFFVISGFLLISSVKLVDAYGCTSNPCIFGVCIDDLNR